MCVCAFLRNTDCEPEIVNHISHKTKKDSQEKNNVCACVCACVFERNRASLSTALPYNLLLLHPG